MPGTCVSSTDVLVNEQPAIEGSRVPLEPLLPISVAELLQARAARTSARRRAGGTERDARARHALLQPHATRCRLSAVRAADPSDCVRSNTPQAPLAGRRHVGRVLRGATVAAAFVQSGAAITLVEEEGGGGMIPLALYDEVFADADDATPLHRAVAVVPSGMSVAVIEPHLVQLPHGRLGLRVDDIKDLRRGSAAAIGVGAPQLPPQHVMDAFAVRLLFDVAEMRRLGDEQLEAGSLRSAESTFTWAIMTVDGMHPVVSLRQDHVLSAPLNNHATASMRLAAADSCPPQRKLALNRAALACAAAAVAVDASYAKARGRAAAALSALGEHRLSDWCDEEARRIEGGYAPRSSAGDATGREYALLVFGAVTAGVAAPAPRLSYPRGDDLKAAQAQANNQKAKGNRLFDAGGGAKLEAAALSYAAAARCLAPLAAPLLLGRAECHKRSGRLPEALCDAAAAVVLLPDCDAAAAALRRYFEELSETAVQRQQAACAFCAEALPARYALAASRGCRTHAEPPPRRLARCGCGAGRGTNAPAA